MILRKPPLEGWWPLVAWQSGGAFAFALNLFGGFYPDEGMGLFLKKRK